MQRPAFHAPDEEAADAGRDARDDKGEGSASPSAAVVIGIEVRLRLLAMAIA